MGRVARTALRMVETQRAAYPGRVLGSKEDQTVRRTSRTLLVMVVAAALLVLAAVPALAAPDTPAAAQPGLHKAHCATMGTPGHAKVPVACSMTPDMCAGMPAA